MGFPSAWTFCTPLTYGSELITNQTNQWEVDIRL
jgi:hypothetical protein